MSIPKFSWITEMLSTMYRGGIEPGQMVGCTRCDFTGPTSEYPVHALTCPPMPERKPMTDPVCTHRWQSATEPGPCQCQGWAGHEGAHRCCCGQEEPRKKR